MKKLCVALEFPNVSSGKLVIFKLTVELDQLRILKKKTWLTF